ncbi:MAG: HAMP domain-containing protein [Coriobacteriia bacterium]|nr:HAMP domain-containing protein [Coriobacteriia bacterium]MBN2839382.1 HAMP domain-containing protein [Coriobacteriia bacterium]
MSVRQRIAIAMIAAVLVNVVAGVASWWLNDRADTNELEARDATLRAEWVGQVGGASTAFMSEATDLALGVRSGKSEEASAEYGDLVGADASVSRLISRMPDGLEDGLARRIVEEWDAVRPGVLAWVNLEAEDAGVPLRLSLTDAGQLRSSTSTNIDADADFLGMEPGAVRRAIRAEAEAFSKGTLRVALSDATADASAARVAAVEARDTAKTVTLAAIALSVLVALAAAVWLYRTIAGPLGRAQESARRVAAGDLETTFEVHGDDEIGSLVEAVEEMRGSVVGQLAVMREMAGAVIVTAEDVTEGARSIRALGVSSDEGFTQAIARVEGDSELLTSLARQMLEA